MPCIFDCKFSPDGLMCAAVDSSGQLTLFGFGSSKPYQQVCDEDAHDQSNDRVNVIWWY